MTSLKHNILTPNQFGFQKNNSTEFAINTIENNIINSFENKEIAYCIFLDFVKAFDTVNHDITNEETRILWYVRGVCSNLCSRLHEQQCTGIGDTLSGIEYTKCAVPRGSILGPLLFLIYINNIVKSSSILRFFLFADDNNILHQ